MLQTYRFLIKIGTISSIDTYTNSNDNLRYRQKANILQPFFEYPTTHSHRATDSQGSNMNYFNRTTDGHKPS